MNRIFETIVNLLFLGFGNKLKGYRTIIIAIITMILGIWEWVSSGLTALLCSSFQVACDFQSTKLYAVTLVIVGALQAILRKLTDTAPGERK